VRYEFVHGKGVEMKRVFFVGHFVLEEQSLQVSVLIKRFFGRIFS